MTYELPDGHSVRVYMRVETEPEILVGTARTMNDVPRLLKAIAEQWHRKSCIEVDNKRYFATAEPDTLFDVD